MFRVVRRSARRSARRFARREEKKKKRGVCATQRRLRKSRESCVTRRIDRGRAAPSAARSLGRDARGIPANGRGSREGARPSVGARPRARKHARDVGRCPAISSEKRGETIANFPGTRTRRVAGSVGSGRTSWSPSNALKTTHRWVCLAPLGLRSIARVPRPVHPAPAARALAVSGRATPSCRLREVARRLESAATRGAAALVEHTLTVADDISRRSVPASVRSRGE